MLDLAEGDFILFHKIPVLTIKLSKRRFQIFLDISLPEKLIGKVHRPQNKTYIRGASPGVLDQFMIKHHRRATKGYYFSGTSSL